MHVEICIHMHIYIYILAFQSAKRLVAASNEKIGWLSWGCENAIGQIASAMVMKKLFNKATLSWAVKMQLPSIAKGSQKARRDLCRSKLSFEEPSKSNQRSWPNCILFFVLLLRSNLATVDKSEFEHAFGYDNCNI